MGSSTAVLYCTLVGWALRAASKWMYTAACVGSSITRQEGEGHAVRSSSRESIEWKDHFWPSGKAPFFSSLLLYMFCVCGPRPPLSFPIFKLLFFFFLPILHCYPIETETNGLSCYMYVGVPGADRHRHKIDQTRYAPDYSLAPNPFFSSSFTRPNLCAAYVYTQRERKKRKP